MIEHGFEYVDVGSGAHARKHVPAAR